MRSKIKFQLNQSIKKSIFTFLFLGFLSLGIAQPTDAGLIFKIKLSIEKGKLDNSSITITKDGQPFKVLDPTKGKNMLELAINSNFLFTFTKKGYITKSIIVDTHVPKGKELDLFNEFIAEVSLEPQPEDKIVTYSQPVGKISFSNVSGDFDYERDYTASAKAQQQKDREKAVPKPKEPVAAKPAATQSENKGTGIVAVKQPQTPPVQRSPKTVESKPAIPASASSIRNKEERIVQKDRMKVTFIIITSDGVEYQYKKEEYNWGGIYYYKGDMSITESTFMIETR